MKIKVQRNEVEFTKANRIFYNGFCYQFMNGYGQVAVSRMNKLINEKKLIECECPENYKNFGTYDQCTWYKLNEEL